MRPSWIPRPRRPSSCFASTTTSSVPKLGVGVVKGRSKGVLAVYSADRKEILAVSQEYLYDPFVMLHEFYHHLRQFAGHHRGTEKNADKFALDFIAAYRRVASGLSAT